MRENIEALDEILGKRFGVLIGGFVRVVDYMGGDAAVLRAARVSYGKGTKSVSKDRTLIRYLLRNRHTSPFEHAEIALHVRVPMDTWRQWIRHRTASVNEYSTRYSEAINATHTTAPDEWRAQSAGNKQGSGQYLDPAVGEPLTNQEREVHDLMRAVYQTRLDLGVAREQARKDLPLSTYTEAYWKINLHNLLHFLGLRMDHHAQEEIRRYATVIGEEIVARWCPLTWEAFRDYRLDAMALSGPEVELIRQLLLNESPALDRLSARELQEFRDKAERLGLDRIREIP